MQQSLGYICLVIHTSTLSKSMFAEASPISVQYQVTLSEKLCHSHQILYHANNCFGQPQMRCFASLTQIFQNEHKNCFCKPYFWWIAGYFIYIWVALLSHFSKVKNDKWVSWIKAVGNHDLVEKNVSEGNIKVYRVFKKSNDMIYRKWVSVN